MIWSPISVSTLYYRRSLVINSMLENWKKYWHKIKLSKPTATTKQEIIAAKIVGLVDPSPSMVMPEGRVMGYGMLRFAMGLRLC